MVVMRTDHNGFIGQGAFAFEDGDDVLDFRLFADDGRLSLGLPIG